MRRMIPMRPAFVVLPSIESAVDAPRDVRSIVLPTADVLEASQMDDAIGPYMLVQLRRSPAVVIRVDLDAETFTARLNGQG